MQDFINFCLQLGSVAPTPGGGAAAGLALSMAASCVEKAARFSLGEKLSNFIDSFTEIRDSGFALAAEDQKAFLAWQEARKLPKATNEEKNTRQKKVDFYAAQSTKVPFIICQNSYKLSQKILEFIPDCNKWLISDVGVAASLSNASFESGILNININKPYLKDTVLIQEISDFLESKESHFKAITEEILAQCRLLLKN